ncbi:MAG: hypothetical protein AB1489_18490 [Acidobacteriota bacterium]
MLNLLLRSYRWLGCAKLNIRLIGGLLTIIATLLLVPAVIRAYEDEQEVAQRSKAILTQHCFRCHGQNGVASKNIFILNHKRLLADRVVVPKDAKSLLLKMVESGAMPLGGPKLAESDQEVLRTWVRQGALDWDEEKAVVAPTTFLTESDILALIEKDLLRSSERSFPFLRYFSLAHLYNMGESREELANYRIGLAKLLNSLSWQRQITVPQPIDAAKTIFRIDLRDYGWTVETWDRILAAYPYGIRILEADRILRVTGSKLPYVRADWFVATASIPPLYHDLLALPRTVAELEKMLGVEAARNIAQERNVVRAGLRNSGVSQNNRALERHISTFGAYWKSYDFANNRDSQNIFKDPLRFNAVGGEIIFNLPNGMQAYFLVNSENQRIDEAPIAVVADRNNPNDPIIRNGRSCMSCHFAGMKTFKDDVRAVILAQPLSNFDREKVLALYPTQDLLDQLLTEDQNRFRYAVEQAGGKLSANVQTEPINAMARRFEAELSAAQAAAEVGLDIQEFRALIRRNRQLSAQGLEQLLVADGGFKRDAWERLFGDLVSELRLGDYIPGSEIALRLQGTRINSSTSALTLANSASTTTTIITGRVDPVELLRTAKTILLHSRTTFLNPAQVENELRRHTDFQALQLNIVKDRQAADLIMELDRPLFTFTFTFNVTDRQTSLVVASGKVTAFDGNLAAPKIAKEFTKQLRAVRPR